METVLDLDEQQSEPSVETPEPNEKQPEPQAEAPQKSEEDIGDSVADEMLNQHFEQPVRFITYTGIKDLSVVKTKLYTVWGTYANGELLKMAKLYVLFAFPKEKMAALKPYVKIRAPLKAENLEPVETIAERYHVDDELLEQAKENGSNVNIVTRAGYILNGCIESFDKYVLYMQLGEEIVIVYRHGLFEFTIEEQSEDVS